MEGGIPAPIGEDAEIAGFKQMYIDAQQRKLDNEERRRIRERLENEMERERTKDSR